MFCCPSHRLLPSLSRVSTIISKRNYEAFRSGSKYFEQIQRRDFDRLSYKERVKHNFNILKEEFKFFVRNAKKYNFLRVGSEMNYAYSFADGEIVKFWDFNQANKNILSSYDLDYKKDMLNDMNNWRVTVDADYDVGFSKASFTVSPDGYGLFSGNIDTTVPKDGRTIRAGYAYLYADKCRQPFFIQSSLDILEDATHVALRCRGDGRRYLLQFDTSTRMDFTWFDRYQYAVYTHGGPYWQYVKIPLTRFTFQYQGFLQDTQETIQPDKIKSVGILLADSIPGPFRFELDYIGFIKDRQHNDATEYEGYFHEASKTKDLASF